jgi:hypothetical protein
MKIIFLDFDGVILTARTQAAARAEAGQRVGWSRANPDQLVCAVLRACCAQGCRLVISSAWRDMGPKCDEKLKAGRLADLLHADWRTTLQTSGGLASDRPWQIAEWLSRHPEVTSYRIVDDEDWHWTGDQRIRFVKCDPMDGMPGKAMHALLSWALGETEDQAA